MFLRDSKCCLWRQLTRFWNTASMCLWARWSPLSVILGGAHTLHMLREIWAAVRCTWITGCWTETTSPLIKICKTVTFLITRLFNEWIFSSVGDKTQDAAKASLIIVPDDGIQFEKPSVRKWSTRRIYILFHITVRFEFYSDGINIALLLCYLYVLHICIA